MDEPMVRFPAKCPVCGGKAVGAYRLANIADAFINNREVHLYAICHDQSWIASDLEVAQIREYLGTFLLGEH